VIELLPASMKVPTCGRTIRERGLYHCHVAEHMREGMFARMTIPRARHGGSEPPPGGVVSRLSARGQSLRIDRRGSRPRGERGERELNIEGALTVFDGFAVFNEPLRIRSARGPSNCSRMRDGMAEVRGVSFRVKNAERIWVVCALPVRAGVMEFELTLPRR
jgi:hypothetical protein